jgi:hypothetical protein
VTPHEGRPRAAGHIAKTLADTSVRKRPPPEHRFKPGNNANPKGRRKGTKNRRVVVQDVLLEQITVREGGETKQMSKLEALLKKTMSDALAGDKKSAGLIFAIAQREGLLTPEQEEALGSVAETDAAIIFVIFPVIMFSRTMVALSDRSESR